MASGQPGPRGGFTKANHPKNFPNDIADLQKKCMAEEKLRTYDTNTTLRNSSDEEVTKDTHIGSAIGFTIYFKGSGSWNVEVSPTLQADMWTDFSVDANGDSKDLTADGYLSSSQHHNYVRAVLRSGANGEIWIYKKYVTY